MVVSPLLLSTRHQWTRAHTHVVITLTVCESKANYTLTICILATNQRNCRVVSSDTFSVVALIKGKREQNAKFMTLCVCACAQVTTTHRESHLSIVADYFYYVCARAEKTSTTTT